ncbi:DinB family protein [Aquimarina sp. RZ0]|uniref:DinB family protein n=1 Tax=Aquimarina sp. RZ0 TaxID=2607730 RepID=UPI00210501E4|nr:DinB family protein [Aquimarina sp. RZ0]
MSQQVTPKSAFLEKWKNSKEYLLAIADAMPEDKYAYKPTDREMDFKNQLLHICGNMRWLGTTYFSEEKFDRKKLSENNPEKKKDIISFLSDSFDMVYDKITKTEDKELELTVDFFAGNKSKLQILNLLQDHVTHHRGQLIVYLNLNEIKPPEYVGW